MKKIRLKQISLIIIALTIFSASVIFIFRKQLVSYFIPKVERIGYAQIKTKSDSLILITKLLVINKSFLSIHISCIKYKVTLQEKTYLQSEKFVDARLSGHEKDTIDLSINIPYDCILRDLCIERVKEGSPTYLIQLILVYSTIFGQINIPINKLVKFNIPQPPEIKILNIKYKKVYMKYILAEAKIKITNYSALPLSIKELSYSLNILRQGNLKGNLNVPIKINPKGNAIFSLPIEINVDNIGKTFFNAIMDNDIYYYAITLNAIMDVRNSLNESYRIKIRKNGMMELEI